MSPPRPLVNCSRPSLYLPPIPNRGTSCEKTPPQDDRNSEQTVSRTNPRIGLALSVFFFIGNRGSKSRRRGENRHPLFALAIFRLFFFLVLALSDSIISCTKSFVYAF